ncbi:DUF2243 domain-containing protein [Clavibacter zhangzhiyongii]|uniref:DUF2243 domain-containing protein n=1 Tax=Clavibacter zhangzhiyongii TaxID=2768071 RepID=UPI00195E6F91|nr:DUF2243 domain-containing protein [Clavibacter zhangzhiyongii]MBM7026678.1 DUF2243 domain-containing protein [Clavibacter zhangzhiyongii]
MSATTSGTTASPSRDAERLPGRSLVAGLLLGIGTATFVDETVFHQLLRWHHFYDRSTTEVGLISDGILHAVGWAAAIGAMFLFADLRRRRALVRTRWAGGLLAGAGGFQLYDGTVQHKVMGLHEIRYGVDLLAYDLVWNGVGAVLLGAGVVLILRTRTRASPRRASTGAGERGDGRAPGA